MKTHNIFQPRNGSLTVQEAFSQAGLSSSFAESRRLLAHATINETEAGKCPPVSIHFKLKPGDSVRVRQNIIHVCQEETLAAPSNHHTED